MKSVSFIEAIKLAFTHYANPLSDVVDGKLAAIAGTLVVFSQ